MLTASEIARALGGRRSGPGWITRCLVHRDTLPSLSLRDGPDGLVLVHCFAGCTFAAIRDELAARGLWPEAMRRCDPDELARRRVHRQREENARLAERRAQARQLWTGAEPIAEGSLAARYLIGRGLFPLYPPTLRFGPYAGTGTRNRWPALIAVATRWPGRDVEAVQVTPLAEPGRKAWDKPARLTVGPLAGAAVRLSRYHPGQPVILVEGVEDGLAVLAAMHEAAVWAVLGATNAGAVILPDGADVVLALDGDDAGRAAAKAAVPALWSRGHKVRVAHLPDGADPLDLLQRNAP